MHSSYQLNTVFTDVYLLLLQNYRSCNMTNRPLFFQSNPAAPLGANPDALNHREPMGNESVYN